MKRWLVIGFFLCLSSAVVAQEETRIVDSLRSVLVGQEGRDKVLTMIELTWEFYDISYDDCLDWGEKAIKEAQNLGFADLEAQANYALGIQYAYHGDLDLSKEYLKCAYTQFSAFGDSKNAFESLWNMATYELTLGSIDTAYQVYEKALSLAEKINDTSACAYVLSNMGLIWYKRGNNEVSYTYYDKAKNMYASLGNLQQVSRMESNLAVIYQERGQVNKAREIYWQILSVFEACNDHHFEFLACKNLGLIYENELVNYDSAMYYFQKAIACSEKARPYRENELFLNHEKSGALVEMGNIMERQGNHGEAIVKYEEALALSENSGYLYGQMEACVGLGKIYSQLGKAQKSLLYFNRYFELEQKSGLAQLRPTFRKALSLDYARLDMMKELEAELSYLENDISESLRENAGLYDENENLKNQLSDFLQQHESQNDQIQTLQSQREQYRLAFFGLVAIVFAALVFLVVYKIVRKKQAKV